MNPKGALIANHFAQSGIDATQGHLALLRHQYRFSFSRPALKATTVVFEGAWKQGMNRLSTNL